VEEGESSEGRIRGTYITARSCAAAPYGNLFTLSWFTFQPQDEIKAFETRASRSNVKKGIPGLPPPVEKPKPVVAKKEPKRAAQKESDISKDMASLKIAEATSSASKAEVASADAAAKDKDPAKRLKALKKKLREINEIEGKPTVSLTPEQTEKVSKKGDIEAEIASLAEFDK
jgi:hypothetical protein